MKLSLNLQGKVALFFAVLIIALTTVLSVMIGFRSGDYMRTEIGDSLSETAYQMSSRIDQYMWGRTSEIRLLAKLDQLKNPLIIERLRNC